MHQNVVGFMRNGMLNKDTDSTQGGIGSLLLIAQLRDRVLLLLRGFLVGSQSDHPL